MATTANPTQPTARRRWRTWTIGALTFYILGASIYLIAGGGGPADPDVPERANRTSSVEFQTLEGSTASLGDYRGRPLVVNFFASTCAPCIQEMPDLERFHQTRGEQVALLGLAVEGLRPARGIVAETGITYDTGLDPGDLLIDFGGVGMPTTVFIDDRGTLLRSHTGLLTYEQLMDMTDELFAS